MSEDMRVAHLPLCVATYLELTLAFFVLISVSPSLSSSACYSTQAFL